MRVVTSSSRPPPHKGRPNTELCEGDVGRLGSLGERRWEVATRHPHSLFIPFEHGKGWVPTRLLTHSSFTFVSAECSP